MNTVQTKHKLLQISTILMAFILRDLERIFKTSTNMAATRNLACHEMFGPVSNKI
jgi:hypothetical protein